MPATLTRDHELRGRRRECYRLGAGSAMPPLLLDEDEDEDEAVVGVRLRAAAAGTVTGIEETSLRALTKLEQTPQLPTGPRFTPREPPEDAATPSSTGSRFSCSRLRVSGHGGLNWTNRDRPAAERLRSCGRQAMAGKKLNLIDRAWLLGHRPDMPLHVAGLAVFAPPDDAGDDFAQSLMADFCATRTFAQPFNQRLRQTRFPTLTPVWEVLGDEEVDIDHHVRHSTLPHPGGERQLGVLVSDLHSRPHDLTRPLWEFHVIDGLADGRFAMYLKVHHALIDGVGLMRRLTRMVTDDPDDRDRVPVWAVGARGGASTPRPPRPRASPGKRITGGVALGAAFVRAAASIAREAVRPSNPDAATLFGAPRSVLNGRTTQRRRVATQSFELERIKQVATAADATVNDVFLSISSAALRRYLTERGQLPEASLTAAVPVAMRDAGDATAGNAFSLLLVKLHTSLAHPVERIAAIAESSRVAKAALAALPQPVANNFGVLVFGPFMVELLLRLAGRTRPPCNLIISNVPGPGGPLYFNGAPLASLYPISLVFDGIALSITALSAGASFNLGIVGCRDAVPHLQRLAAYHGEALTELEHTLNLEATTQGPGSVPAVDG